MNLEEWQRDPKWGAFMVLVGWLILLGLGLYKIISLDVPTIAPRFVGILFAVVVVLMLGGRTALMWVGETAPRIERFLIAGAFLMGIVVLAALLLEEMILASSAMVVMGVLVVLSEMTQIP